MLGFKFNHVSKMGPWRMWVISSNHNNTQPSANPKYISWNVYKSHEIHMRLVRHTWSYVPYNVNSLITKTQASASPGRHTHGSKKKKEVVKQSHTETSGLCAQLREMDNTTTCMVMHMVMGDQIYHVLNLSAI